MPEEWIRRLIKYAIMNEHPLVDPNHDFFIIGFDRFDYSLFIAESFKSKEEALKKAALQNEVEPLWSDDDLTNHDPLAISTSFHVFNKEGDLILSEE